MYTGSKIVPWRLAPGDSASVCLQ